MESKYIVVKKPGLPGGEGIVDDEIITKIKERLYALIEAEIEYSKSADSVYRKE